MRCINGLELTQEQQMYQHAVHDFCAKEIKRSRRMVDERANCAGKPSQNAALGLTGCKCRRNTAARGWTPSVS